MWSKIHGQGDTKGLFLHCALGLHATLWPLAQALNNWEITLVDLLGHGSSGDPGPNTTVDDNVKALENVFHGPGVVFGHSLGAVVALRFALTYPERVTRLVLVEPVLFKAAEGSAGHAQFSIDFEPVGAALAAQNWATATQEFSELWGGPNGWVKQPPIARHYAMERIGIIDVTREDLVDDRTGILAAGLLESLPFRVQLIHGSRTHPVVPDIHAELARRTGGTIHVIEGARHMSPVTHPNEVAALLQA